MNLRLTDQQIREVCSELLARGIDVSGRELRRQLRDRFRAVGKTDRVFAIWRQEIRKAQLAAELQSLPTDVRELQEKLKKSEIAAARNLARAELSELREQAHQDFWALEIDRVKQELEESRRQNSDQQGRVSRPFRV